MTENVKGRPTLDYVPTLLKGITISAANDKNLLKKVDLPRFFSPPTPHCSRPVGRIVPLIRSRSSSRLVPFTLQRRGPLQVVMQLILDFVDRRTAAQIDPGSPSHGHHSEGKIVAAQC